MMRAFLNDRAGATSIEYALIASIVVFAILGALGPIGQTLDAHFREVEAGLSAGQ
jgi:pilus assembly protein Flp/PilA